MKLAIYLMTIFASFLINSLLYAQSSTPPTQKRAKNKQTACSSGRIGEYREAATKTGVANVICLVTGFNTRNDQCWQYLAEYYYNVVPAPGVKIQRIYFVEVPEGTKSIRTLAELKNSSFRRNTFYECIYNATTGGYSFVNYPFAAK